MGNLASGHFKPTNKIQAEHNDRTLSPNYLIPEEFRGQNEVNRPSTQARGLRDEIIENAINIYENTKKKNAPKFKAKSYQWSLVVNIKTNTTMSDLEKLAEHFEVKYGFQCYQIAIHRDEGYMDENNQPHINHHAHMEFITLKKENGKNMMRKAHLSPKKFADMQTEIAQILGMERGTDKRVSGTERIEPRKYAQMKNKERKELETKEKELNTLKQERTDLKDKIQEKDKEIATINTLNAKLEKTNKDLQRPSMWDTVKEKIIDATKNARKIEELKQENNRLLEQKEQENENLKQENKKLEQENADLNKEITTALNTANSLWFFEKLTLQEAVERNNEQTEKYLAIKENHENRNPDFVEKIAKKYRYDSGFTNLFNALKEVFSLRKLFASIKKILFGDENAEKDPQEIEQTIKELSERPTKSELEKERKCRKEAVRHYQEAEKIVFGKVNMGSLLFELVTDDAAKKLNERLTELKEKESKLNTLESTDLALDLEKSQHRVKTLESNETALKNDLNAKESIIQAKEKELNTLKQERTDLKDKIQAQEKTINELNKKLQELEYNYRLERERMQAENKRLKDQGLEKIYTQKDYEQLKEQHLKEIEALKKEIQEQDKYKTKSNALRYQQAKQRKAMKIKQTTTPTPSPTPQPTYTPTKRI